jgi:type I restriction enzyme S subunit
MIDAQQFLKAFGHVANAPGGVAQLRALILELAVRGQLLPTANSASNARDLLREIEQFRSELVRNGKLRRPIPQPAISESELPFAIPENWAFERLGNICEIVRGVTFPATRKLTTQAPGAVACLRTSNVQAEIDWNDLIFIDSELVGREDQWVEKGDTMISMANSYELVGKVALVSEVKQQTTFGGFIAAVRPHVLEPAYLYLLLRSPYLQAKMRETSSQTTNIANISLGGMRPIPTPIPPKEEQALIVAKVNDLMALCDKLETQQQVRHKLQNSLRQATLQAVTSATSPHELQTTWASLVANFGRLFHAPKDVDDFIAELKNLAVRGLLETASAEPPAVDAIKASCDALRASYIESGLMRRQKIIAAAETDVTYPAHWAVAPFDEVAVVIGGVTKGRDLRGRETLNCPYLAVANVQRGFIKLEGLKTIEIAADELEKYAVHEGDLLITEGGDWDKVGRTAIWRGGVAACLHQNHVFKARVPSKLLVNEWVELVFNSSVGRDYFAGASKQTTNLASINMTQLRGFPLPIPPLDEQHNLLKTLQALTANAQAWRQQLQRKQELAAKLAGTTISSFTGIKTNQSEEPMKAPQTELIAPLRLGQTPSIKAQAPLATILARHHGQMPAKDLWQRFGGEIDAFYAQLKTEVAHGWILEPGVAEVREVPAINAGA